MSTDTSDLARWVAKGLISDNQAIAINADLEQTTREAQPAISEPHSEAPSGSVLLEGVAYIGGAVALTAALAAVGLYWSELSGPGQLGIPVVLCLALFVGGIGLQGTTKSNERIGSTMWAASTLFFAISVSIASYVFDLQYKFTPLAICVATTVFAFVLWVLKRRSLQHLFLFASLAATIGSVFACIDTTLDTFWYSLAFWSLGVIWLLQTWAKVLHPRTLGLFLGSASMLLSNIAYGIDGSSLALGWGAVSVLVVVSIGIKFKEVVIFGLGALGAAALIAITCFRYLSGSFGALLGLFAAGAVILAGVIIYTQLRRTNVAK